MNNLDHWPNGLVGAKFLIQNVVIGYIIPRSALAWKDLSQSIRFDQHLVGYGGDSAADAEQGAEHGVAGAAALELRERTGKIGYGNLRRDDCSLFVLCHPPPAITPYFVLPERGG